MGSIQFFGSVSVPTVPVVYDDESSAAGGLTMEMNSYIQDHYVIVDRRKVI
jgi:hypothetical protein